MKTEFKNEKGSMLIAVLLIMLMISAISISLLVRSSQGTQIGIISKDSHNAYQRSDQNVENVLTSLQKLDAHDTDGLIPENTQVSKICTGDSKCYPKNGDGTPDTDNELSPTKFAKDIYFVQRNGESSTSRTQRAVLAPVMDRTYNPIDADSLSVDETLSDPALCRAVIKFKCLSASDNKLEIRMSTDGNDSDSDFKGKWMKLLDSDDSSNDKCKDSTDPNEEVSLSVDASHFKKDISGPIYFIVKAKNDRKFSLDSLYYKVSGSFAPNGSACTGS
ncbi:MAG: hypothetical protein HGB08_04660 [Candidatus Moranbacteria bacterium]|nr:hypothetical protein [Candidatus Moranbacteria bacterium]